MMTVRGNVLEITADGYIDPHRPEASSVEVPIQTASIRTNNPQRDNDLRASNFLEADKYPTMHFKSTKIEQTGPETYNTTGDLTIKGNTHPVTLKVLKYGEFNDPNMIGHRMAQCRNQGQPQRFGMTFSMMLRWQVDRQ